jgi:hypothetical protein
METRETRTLSRRAAAFTQAEVSRAIRAADKAGGHRWEIAIERDGTIRLVPHDSLAQAGRRQLPKRKIVL